MKSKNIQSIINESLFDEVKKTILRENKESDENPTEISSPGFKSSQFMFGKIKL